MSRCPAPTQPGAGGLPQWPEGGTREVTVGEAAAPPLPRLASCGQGQGLAACGSCPDQGALPYLWEEVHQGHRPQAHTPLPLTPQFPPARTELFTSCLSPLFQGSGLRPRERGPALLVGPAPGKGDLLTCSDHKHGWGAWGWGSLPSAWSSSSLKDGGATLRPTGPCAPGHCWSAEGSLGTLGAPVQLLNFDPDGELRRP